MKKYQKSKRPHRNIAKLVFLYRKIKEYQEKEIDNPSYKDLVEMGCAKSTSVISFYYNIMAELDMIQFTKGRQRSVRLLPAENFHISVIEYLDSERKEKGGLK